MNHPARLDRQRASGGAVAQTSGEPFTPYEPPDGDAPLDDVQRAIVRALVDIIVAEIREEEATRELSGTGKLP